MANKVDNFIESHCDETLYFVPICIENGSINGWISKNTQYTMIFYNTALTLEDQLVTLTHETHHYHSINDGTFIFGTDTNDWDEEMTTQRETAYSVVPFEKVVSIYETGSYDNDYEVAEELGVSIKYLREVMNLYNLMNGQDLANMGYIC